MALTRAAALPAVALAALLAGCGIGQTGPASRVTDVGATLSGKARNTESGATRWRFEYGTSPTYGNATPWRESGAVEETIGGLAHGTTHHFRLCASDEHGRGVCGADKTFTTTDGEDSVVGAGVLVDAAEFSYQATVDAHSGASGAAPRGTARARPGASSPREFDEGPVVCLRVDGDRASVGIDVTPPIAGMPHTGRVIYVKDNGPAGDYLAHYERDTPPATCLEATDDKFISETPGQPPFAALVSGDFQVHDHPSGTSSRR